MSIKSHSQHIVCKSSAIKISAKKIKILNDSLKKAKVKDALNILNFSKKAVSKQMIKLFYLAISDAEHNYKMDADSLSVHTISVEKAFVLRRIITKGRGRAGQIKKRYSRIRLVLESSSI